MKAVALASALLLAGCSAQVPASNAAVEASRSLAPTLTPSPSPTSINVVAALEAYLAAATSGVLTMSGTITVGSVVGVIRGTVRFNDEDLDELTTVRWPERVVLTASRHVAGVGYTQTPGGPWLKDLVAPAAGANFGSFLQGIVGLTDVGIQTKNGESLHRLELPAGSATASATFGLTGPAMTGGVVSLTFWADEAGLPVYLSVTATGPPGETAVQILVDESFDQIGTKPTILPPDHVWNRFASTRFRYFIIYPNDWTVSTSSKVVDEFNMPYAGYGSSNVDVGRSETQGRSLNQLIKDEIAAFATLTPDPMSLVWNIDYTLAGRPARLLLFHATDVQFPLSIYEVILVSGSYMYRLSYWSLASDDGVALTQFKQMLSGFAFR